MQLCANVDHSTVMADFLETPLEVLKVNEQEVREEYRAEDRHRKKETEKTETQKKCWSF